METDVLADGHRAAVQAGELVCAHLDCGEGAVEAEDLLVALAHGAARAIAASSGMGGRYGGCGSTCGPVYTPPEHRGHGYASSAVADVTRQILAAGARACLFTDQARTRPPNKIYADLGYRPVVDMANLVIRR